MKKLLIFLLLAVLLAVPVRGIEAQAPELPDGVEASMPPAASLGEGLSFLLREGVRLAHPALHDAAARCLGCIALVLLSSMLGSSRSVELACGTAIGMLLLTASHSMINLGVETVQLLSQYGKLLLPVMTGILASQGGIAGAAALYSGTMVFNAVLGALISRLLVPALYGMLALALANCAVGENTLRQLQSFLGWLTGFLLKGGVYLFTAYLSLTNVISGGADAAAIKAAKMTISGTVPLVGGMLADASEAVLVSAGLVKRAVGLYGMLALLTIWLAPFLRIGALVLLLRGTTAVCSIFGSKRITGLMGDFSKVMGLVLSMTGTMCLLLLVSTVCFLKGMS